MALLRDLAPRPLAPLGTSPCSPDPALVAPAPLTSVPLDRSSRTKGKTPKMTSTPLLSAKIKAHL